MKLGSQKVCAGKHHQFPLKGFLRQGEASVPHRDVYGQIFSSVSSQKVHSPLPLGIKFFS